MPYRFEPNVTKDVCVANTRVTDKE